MKTKILLSLIFITNIACAQKKFPEKYKEKVFKHIENLCSFGIRNDNTAAGQKTIKYIAKEFKSAGLKVSMDTFTYETFIMDSSIVKIGKTVIKNPERLFIAPYENRKTFGNGVLCSPAIFSSAKKIDEENSILLISENDSPFRYLFGFTNIKAAIIISDSVFNGLKNQELNIFVEVFGKVEERESYNIMGVKEGDSPNEIIVSAHWDCFGGPGANDNASGIASMLELSKYLLKNSSSQTMKFVAFGAEEVGLLGSRAYVQQHFDELKKCKFIFNIDAVGGEEKIRVEMQGGIKGSTLSKEDFASMRLKASHGENGKWLNLDKTLLASFNVSNIPKWLEENIVEANEKLGYNLRPSQNIGSDHKTFHLAGISGISIATSGSYGGHTPEDVVSKINRNSLEKVGKLISLSILNVINAE